MSLDSLAIAQQGLQGSGLLIALQGLADDGPAPPENIYGVLSANQSYPFRPSGIVSDAANIFMRTS